MNYDKIGEFIQERRKAKKLTQKELADLIGVTDKAVSKWERGQGCPDVSILEVLSKELDCSILELLKGREIKNEVIPLTEADDYVKESISLQSSRLHKIINHLIEIIIIFLVLLLLYLNIIQLININHQQIYTFKDDPKITNYITTLEKNINTIKQSQGLFETDDYETLLTELENSYKLLQKEKIYNYLINNKTLTYTTNSLYSFYLSSNQITPQNKIITILQKYSDKKYLNYFLDNTAIDISYNIFYTKQMATYKYSLFPFENNLDKVYPAANLEIIDRLYKMRHDISNLTTLSQLIIEVGDISD